MKELIADYDRDVPAGNRIADILKQAAKARNFPTNTDPLSRHLHLAGECLIKTGSYPMCQEEPIHIGKAMVWAAGEIWRLRTLMEKHGVDPWGRSPNPPA